VPSPALAWILLHAVLADGWARLPKLVTAWIGAVAIASFSRRDETLRPRKQSFGSCTLWEQAR